MNAPKGFQIAEGYACYRPVGALALQEAIELVRNAVTFASKKGIRRLLIDTTQLTGFRPPNVVDRYEIGSLVASAPGAQQVRVVLVAKAELIHPNKFGVMVARNRGMQANVFAAKAEALQWLLGEKDD